MMHARAVATPLVQQRLYDEGLRAIETGIDAIREFLDDYDQSHRAEECVELVSLERWREEILGKEQRRRRTSEERRADSSPEAEAAIAAEEFEEAAQIRDQIRKLGEAETRMIQGLQGRLDESKTPNPLKTYLKTLCRGVGVSIGGEFVLLASDAAFDGSFLLSLCVCPIWFLVSVLKNAIQRPRWRLALLRTAIPTLTLGLVLANDAVQSRIAKANAA